MFLNGPFAIIAEPDIRNRYLMAEDNKTGVLSSDWSDQHGSVVNFATFPISANSLYCIQIPFLAIGSGGNWRDWTAPNSATYSEWFTFFKFRPDTVTSGVNIFNIQSSGAASNCLTLNFAAGGAVQVVCGTANATTTGTMTVNTTYNVWCHYKAGSGANAIASVAFSTSENEPISGPNFAGVTNGSITANAAIYDLECTGPAGSGNFFFGKCRVATRPIGSNPP